MNVGGALSKTATYHASLNREEAETCPRWWSWHMVVYFLQHGSFVKRQVVDKASDFAMTSLGTRGSV